MQTDKAFEYTIENNPFNSLAIDITNRCNMSCNYCWNPERISNDIQIEEFEKICQSLPSPTIIKLMGGEPTLHPDLPRLLEIAHYYGHKSTIVSNGLRFSDINYTKQFKKLNDKGIRFTITLSLDGGKTNKAAHKIINGDEKYLALKNKALQTCLDIGVGRICLAALIIRDINESSIKELIQIATDNDKYIRYIHFRNMAPIGRWKNSKPYTFNELKSLVGKEFSETEFQPKCIGEIHCPKNSCCYRFRPTARLQISIIDFGTKEAMQCPYRGRYSLKTKTVKQFFQSME